MLITELDFLLLGKHGRAMVLECKSHYGDPQAPQSEVQLRQLDQLIGVRQRVTFVVPATSDKEEGKAIKSLGERYPKEMGFDVLVIRLDKFREKSAQFGELLRSL